MTEIKGLLLSREEEQACLDLVRELRKRKTYAIDFSGYVKVKAKTPQEANDLFWQWVESIRDKTDDDWTGVVPQPPIFQNDGVEEE